MLRLFNNFLIFLLLSCAGVRQQTEIPYKLADGTIAVLKTSNASISLMSKHAVARMVNASGEIDGITSDATDVPIAGMNTALGMKAIQGITDVTKINKSSETKQVISNNKRDVSLEEIKVDGEVQKSALQLQQ